jgi:hypothetical protein
MTGMDEANGRSAGGPGSAAGGATESISGSAAASAVGSAAGSAAGTAAVSAAGGAAHSSQGRAVRDREVLLLAAFCVVVVLGLQFLGIVFPPFADAIGRPPTVIVALVVVTVVVLARALWASIRHA